MSNLLVVGPSWVGDMVMAQPLLARLKAAFSDISLSLLAPAWSLPLAERMGVVDEAIPLPFGHGVLDLKGRYQCGRALRAHHFEQAFILPNSFKSALVPFFANIPMRTGFVGEWRYGIVNDSRPLDKATTFRLVDRYFSLAFAKNAPFRAAPAPCLSVDPENVKNTLQQFGIQSCQPILAVCPGAEFGPSKQWSVPYYAQVVQQYIAKGWQVCLFGSSKDRAVTAAIAALCQEKCIDLSGRTTLAEAIDLMGAVTLVVTNDSGLMHIASGLAKPLVAVYGSTDPYYTPPLGPASRIVRSAPPCSPCFERVCRLGHHRCMQEVLPEQVLEQLEDLEQRIAV